MTNDTGIYIKNIFYMLTYAFQILKQLDYEKISAENFERIQDLFAAILAKGVARQLKQGLFREYITRHDDLPALRGRLDFPGTVRNRVQRRQRLNCLYDEISENNLYNRILKTTMCYLVKDNSVSDKQKAALNRVLVYFKNIDVLVPSAIPWKKLHLQQNNRNYEALMNICYFVLDGLLQKTEKGDYRMATFSDVHMARLFERFILEYYRCHHTYLSEVKAAQVKWNLQGENDDSMIRFLPVMQTDIFLRYKEKILILDAKYYGKILQQRFDRYTLHSGNIYQIFSYVKNQDKDNTGNVSGMLIYAKTDEEITPDCIMNMGGNMIGVTTLDLNQDFTDIAQKLDDVAEHFFGKQQLSHPVKKSLVLN